MILSSLTCIRSEGQSGKARVGWGGGGGWLGGGQQGDGRGLGCTGNWAVFVVGVGLSVYVGGIGGGGWVV